MREKLAAQLARVLASTAATMLLILYVPAGGNDVRDKFTPNYDMVFSGSSRLEKLASLFRMDYSRFDYYTSQSLPITASKVMNLAYNAATGNALSRYSIFFLAVIYVAMAAAGMGLIVECCWKRRPALGAFAFIAAILVFCDQGYIMYFNSFY
jgi:hypothetical protein